MIKEITSQLYFVADLDKTLEFYRALGFKAEKDDGMVNVKVGQFLLSFIDKKNSTFKKEFDVFPKGAGVFTYVRVDDVDAFYEKIVKKGIEPFGEPKDWPWGNREFVIKDPDGYKLVIFKKN